MTHVNQNNETVTSSLHQSSLQPLDKNKRIDALDILRGLALVGILLMNIEWFNRAITSFGGHDTSLTGFDHAVSWIIRCFVEGKFYKLFALIFGMGFAVMLLRAKEAERPFKAWFIRRMLVLLLLGLAHMIFLWGGDILHDYAVAGLVLLVWVSYKKTDDPRAYLKLALMWLVIPLFIVSFGGSIFGMIFNDAKYQDRWQDQLDIHTIVEQQLKNDIEVAPQEDEIDDNASPTSEETTLTLLSDEEIRAITIAEAVEERQELQTDIAEEKAAFMQDSYWKATQYRFSFSGFMMMLTPFLSLLFCHSLF